MTVRNHGSLAVLGDRLLKPLYEWTAMCCDLVDILLKRRQTHRVPRIDPGFFDIYKLQRSSCQSEVVFTLKIRVSVCLAGHATGQCSGLLLRDHIVDVCFTFTCRVVEALRCFNEGNERVPILHNLSYDRFHLNYY